MNSITYVAVLVALLRIDRDQLRTSKRVTRARGQLREGFRYVWSTPELRLPLVLLTVIGTLAFEFQVTLPLLAERSFGGDAGTFTMLYSSMSAGSVVGALLIARRTDADTRMLARAALAMGLSMTFLAVAPNEWIGLIAVVPLGLSSIFLISGSNAVINLHADPSMRGRALALTAVVFLGSTPIGGPIAGWVSEHLGARAGVGMGAIATLLAAAWTFRALRNLATSPVDIAHRPGDLPAPAVVRS